MATPINPKQLTTRKPTFDELLPKYNLIYCKDCVKIGTFRLGHVCPSRGGGIPEIIFPKRAAHHMDVDCKILYAFRGWLGFLAFMDLGITAKSFIERRSFLTKNILEYNDDEYTISRILGMFALLKAMVLIYSTLYIYCKPIVDLGRWSVAITILLYFNETICYHTSTMNPSVIFPCILNIVTLMGMFYLPYKLDIWGLRIDSEEENSHLLKHIGTVRRRKHIRKL